MTKQHGGKRQGSGRKHVAPQEPTVRVTVHLPKSQYIWLQQQSNNVSAYIRILIKKAQDHE
jgi:hypothetical protein